MTTQPDRIPLDDLTSDALDALYDQLEAAESTELARQLDTCRDAFASATSRAARAEARVRELEAQVARLTPGTTPAEHCGHQIPALTKHTERTECVLRPGHHGSHANQHGARWWWISNAEATP
ncbi:hypothetical protein LT966_21650 [Streptomyces griseobrunneus]